MRVVVAGHVTSRQICVAGQIPTRTISTGGGIGGVLEASLQGLAEMLITGRVVS